jgi:sporulation protein YlmC with PRC-barrel domain
MTSESIRQRADLINTQVIAKDTGKRLGIIKDLLVDIDSREVVALGLRDSFLAAPGGLVKHVYLTSVEKMGDVVLVPDDEAIEDLDPEVYTNLINCEVTTETGDMLGKVRGFKFSCEDGKLTSIIIAALGLPLIPDNVVSTYEFSIDEVISSGPNRLIVFEGAEERLEQLSVGFLERIGLGKAPWEDEYSYRPPVIRPENQLPAGMPVAPPPPVIRTERPARQPVWQEEEREWEEVRPEPLPQKLQAEARYYDDEDDGENWNEPVRERPSVQDYRDVSYTPVTPPTRSIDDDDDGDISFPPVRRSSKPSDDDEELLSLEADPWANKETPASDEYQPPKLNIPPANPKVDLPQTLPKQQLEYQEEESYQQEDRY